MAIKIAAEHSYSKMFGRTSEAFTSAGWGEIGLTSINMQFLERVAEAIADAVADVR